jgi:hypothetical protein
MIIEGLVTTTDAGGGMHLAAMGPEVDAADVAAGRLGRLILKPFPTSQTAANLDRLPEGVFHVTDDALAVARVVVGAGEPPPASRPATVVRGRVLEGVCRGYEFRVVHRDTSRERIRLEAEVLAVHEGRPFTGFNRARHAVVEGAILVTRLHLLGAEEVGRRLRELAVLVEKTGGPREHEAFRLLEARVAAG